ncbi:Wzz/FepE/Etk N-terminal domain-containing protein [Clostridium pasteurianum]|uniref:YveK family protein n=1 Tax=Clostridium pasteurianum TaxID=1501 RepID=UPI0022608EE0|nr:Wzz/FepE/Etk N-terminal domain-containing protein [Clostridium pasteurianum]UZW14994.1 Wzz/FepE/Etk N-terminal domain-containing protein [Clostridium pasteurianum]
MNEENTIDLSQIFYILNKRKSIIITITLVAVIISGILSFFIISPVYEAQVTAIVGKRNDAANQNIQYNDVMMYQNLTKTYATIGTSKLVAGKAAEKLGNGMTADKLGKVISVTPETGTQILDISAQGGTPQEALSRVTALSETFVENSKDVYNAGEVKIMDKGELPKAPVKPKKALNIAIAFVLGLMVSVGLSFLLEYMDSTLKTAEDVKKHLDLPVLGTIPVHDEM